MSTFSCPIVTVATVSKHPNADNLDILTFEEVSWVCVEATGKRQPGHKVVYIPIDAKVNTKRSEFAFLAPRAKADGWHRIKTIKLRGNISQGLVVDLPRLAWYHYLRVWFGDSSKIDASRYLDIHKYEPPAEKIFAPNAKGNFPGEFQKSDAERYQNYNRAIEPYLHDTWYATTKIDGTSLTVFYLAGRPESDCVGVCSRNQELKELCEPAGIHYGFSLDVYWKAAHRYNLLEIVKKIAYNEGYTGVAIQGELAGPGIQKNPLGLSEIQFFAFDIQVIEAGKQRFLDAPRFFSTCNSFGIPTVPIYKIGTFLEITGNKNVTNNRLDFSFIEALKYPNGSPIEGLVFVTEEEKQCGSLGRVKVKYINPQFLLKEKD